MSERVAPDRPLLMVDDQEEVLRSQQTLLESEGYRNLLSCSNPAGVLDLMGEREPELVLLDLRMPGLRGETLLERIVEEYPQVPVIVVTGYNEISLAVSCIKKGAFDFVVKGEEPARLLSAIQRALQVRRLNREVASLHERIRRPELTHPGAFERVVTRSPRMFQLFGLIESVALSPEPVLITGETGTGKGQIPAIIHELSGRPGRLVEVNVAGLDDTMFSDTLFGHRRGAFTGATESREGLIRQAEGGTLFLDEIGDLSPQSQIKLLRLTDEREYYPLGADVPRHTDARIICATNKSLADLADSREFRRDLYYRLSTHEIPLPPLRQRPEDLAPLAAHFYRQAAREMGREIALVPADVGELLRRYGYPGNIRELRAMVYDAVSRQNESEFPLEVLRETLDRKLGVNPACQEGPAGRGSGRTAVVFGEELPTAKQVVQMLVDEALRRAEGNQTLAGRMIGLSAQAINNRLRRGR